MTEKEDLAVEVFLEFLNAVEAGVAAAKQRIKEAKLGPEWNPNAIKWVDAQGTSGPYQRYPAEGAKAEATEDYKNLLADLKAHGGKLSRKDPDGTWFYWLFKDAASVGRKRRGQPTTTVGASKPQQTQGTATPSASTSRPKDISQLFPEDVRGLLSFEQKEGQWVIKPKRFLGTENFTRCMEIVRSCNGEYVSLGRDSHFRIPLKQ